MHFHRGIVSPFVSRKWLMLGMRIASSVMVNPAIPRKKVVTRIWPRNSFHFDGAAPSIRDTVASFHVGHQARWSLLGHGFREPGVSINGGLALVADSSWRVSQPPEKVMGCLGVSRCGACLFQDKPGWAAEAQLDVSRVPPQNGAAREFRHPGIFVVYL